MATAQQSAQRNHQLRYLDVIINPDQRPACGQAEADPNWWDMETHTHSGQWSCTPCRAAVATCLDCPVRTQCAKLGKIEGNQWLIYAGKSWSINGVPAPSCRRRACQAPIFGPGRLRGSGMCSRSCEINLDSDTEL